MLQDRRTLTGRRTLTLTDSHALALGVLDLEAKLLVPCRVYVVARVAVGDEQSPEYHRTGAA